MGLQNVHDRQFLWLDVCGILLSLLFKLNDRVVRNEVWLIDLGFHNFLLNNSQIFYEVSEHESS